MKRRKNKVKGKVSLLDTGLKVLLKMVLKSLAADQRGETLLVT